MNICFLLGNLTTNGGIGRVASMLANHLSAQPDVRCRILSYSRTNKPLLYPVEPQITLDDLLPERVTMTQCMLQGGVRKLRRYLEENAVDVLIACGALFFPIASMAARGTDTRCVCWEHTAPEMNHDHRGQALARGFGIKHSDLNVVLTKRAQTVYREKFGCEHTVQIYNPIDPAVFTRGGSYDADAKRIISVGRLTYQKHFDLAVDVAARVLKNHPDWRWDIYGEGEDRAALERQIASLGLNGRVTLCGQVPDLYDRYRDYSFMVMTSRYEGFPMSLLEAMGNGLPLISFDVETGPNEIINDGENGFLVPAEDADTMAARIETLIQDSALRAEMRACALHDAQRFSIGQIVDQWMDTLRTL